MTGYLKRMIRIKNGVVLCVQPHFCLSNEGFQKLTSPPWGLKCQQTMESFLQPSPG